MKKLYLLAIYISFLSITNIAKAQSTGYIVLNEYMPWTTQNCSSSAEFVELYNFGPGPVDIGCYMVTDGDYSITIPPNTIVNAGQFFVIGGMDSIPRGCANVDYSTNVDLNWNTCNCTSGVIPSTNGGLLTDGGSADEQIVFLDPNLKVVDAVVRNLPSETSADIISSIVNGNCVSKKFNLDSLAVNYETIGESAGRGNSFARQVNGDCVWVKDPQQSGGTTNNRSTTVTGSLTSVLHLPRVNACDSNGNVSVSFTGITNYSSIFPVNYILAKDADSNNVFDLNDIYIHAIDSTSPTVDITDLTRGSYRLAIEPRGGCNYQFFSFTILPCKTTVLEPGTFHFSATRKDKYVQLLWTSEKMETVRRFDVEKSIDGRVFNAIQSFKIESGLPSFQKFKYFDLSPPGSKNFYRLKVIYKDDLIAYSPIENIQNNTRTAVVNMFPNPVKDILIVDVTSRTRQAIKYVLLQSDGKILMSKKAILSIGTNKISIKTTAINNGLYIVKMYSNDGSEVVKKFYKQ